jgi:PadR family transcriptional regulator PadR
LPEAAETATAGTVVQPVKRHASGHRLQDHKLTRSSLTVVLCSCNADLFVLLCRSNFEQIVLLATVRLAENAYGVPIRHEIEKRAKRTVSIGALYSTLDRLEAKGFVSSWLSDPTAERGGRSRRYFRVEPTGLRALEHSREVMDMMWKGVKLGKI